ncbi:MAG: MFS transporter [Crocinitomicaceae bacterium]|nr:MFS transporter [Crocinitomicaceae bacterium]
MEADRFKLFDFTQEKVRVLHYTWIAFFLTFFVWFNMAPLKSAMVEAFTFLDMQNFKSLLLCNVALTIPARIIVGALVDKHGPRVVFAGLMVLMLIPGLFFAFGDSFVQLVVSRLLLSSIGAGFVIGIKMTDNWFPPKHIGRAEGFYAGWGNFGSAAAAGLIPVIGLYLIGGTVGWRWSMAISSIITAAYGVFYYFAVRDYPTGAEPKKTSGKKSSIMPVSSRLGLFGYLFWTIPLYAALGLLANNLQKQQIISHEFTVTEQDDNARTYLEEADMVQVLSTGGAHNFFKKGNEIKLYSNGEVSEVYKADAPPAPSAELRHKFENAEKVEVYKEGKLKLKIKKKEILGQYDALKVNKKYAKAEIMPIYEKSDLNGFYKAEVGGTHIRTFKHMYSKEMMYLIWGILALMYFYKAFKILQFNVPRLKAGIPEEEKYPYSSVGALNTTYFANFGAELAVVSMLPMFFEGIFNFTPQMAGFVAMSFAFVNLFARPLGGYLSDKMGSRKKTMLMYMVGITLGFFLMGLIARYDGVDQNGTQLLAPMFEGNWWIVVSVIITMFCSMFVQGAEGATFAMIPAIKKDLTGRIAGMAGAYGNVGAVTYLFILSQVDSKTFFFILSAGAAVSVVACLLLLKEPKNSFGEGEEELVEEKEELVAEAAV